MYGQMAGANRLRESAQSDVAASAIPYFQPFPPFSNMKISIVAGSHRRESESSSVARYIQEILRQVGADRTFLLSLANNPLPLWDEGAWGEDPKWAAGLEISSHLGRLVHTL